MLKKIITKTLVAVFIFNSVLMVTTFAGENDIPRMFQDVPPIYEMK